MRRYQSLAEEFSGKIREGVLRPGDKLPSVRSVGSSHRLSAATVVQAYQLLEDGGLIRTRPQSGHYVCANWQRLASEPQISLPTRVSTVVNVRDLVGELVSASGDREFVSLGAAYPGAGLFPRAKLASALHASARTLDPNSIYDYLPQGSMELRRQISRRYLESGCSVSMDDIIITAGALEALNLSLQAVTRPGDLVAIECPAFYLVLEALERLGLKAVQVPTHPRDGISLSALADTLDRHAIKACWVMTNFQNPLGSTMPDESKQALVKLLAKRNLPLIEDDVYAELYFGKVRPRPAKAFDDGGRVLHCGSFSKCLAPGYRVGWLAPGRYAAQIQRAKLSTTIATSVPMQAAIVEFQKHRGYDNHLRKLRRTFEANMKLMMQAVGRHFPAGTRMTAPNGGYFLWVEMPEGVSAMELHRRAYEKKITIAPGPLFSPERQFENCLRLNYGLEWSPAIEAAIATLGKIARSLR